MVAELKAPTPFDPGNWGEIVSVDTIRRNRVPVQGPDTWRPLPHHEYVDKIESTFIKNGFEISEPVHYRGKSRGNEKILDLPEYGRFLTLYGISHPLITPIEGVTWESGWGNSYDMSIAAGGGLGRRVSVCSNGQYMGAEYGFKAKHTKGIDVDYSGHYERVFNLIELHIGKLLKYAETEAARIERWKAIEVTDDDARYVACEAHKQGVLGAAGAFRVLKHWKTPEHPEFKERNVWVLENAFTSEGRGSSLFNQDLNSVKLNSIINDRFGLQGSVEDAPEPALSESIGDSPNSADF